MQHARTEGLESNQLSSTTEITVLSMRSRKFGTKLVFAKSVTKKNTHDLFTMQSVRFVLCTKTATRSHANCMPEVQVDFAELEDGGLAEVVEDPTDPSRALFAILSTVESG